MKIRVTLPLSALLMGILLSGGVMPAGAQQTDPNAPTNADIRTLNTTANQAQRASDNAARAEQINEFRDEEEDKRGDRALRRDFNMILNRTVTQGATTVIKNGQRQQDLESRQDSKIQEIQRATQNRSEADSVNRELYGADCQGENCSAGTLKEAEKVNQDTRKETREMYQDAAKQNRAQNNPENKPTVNSAPLSVATEKLSDGINNFGKNLTRFPSLFYIMSYICGVFFMAMSLSKANKSVLSPSQNPVSDAVKYAAAGVFLAALPLTTDTLHDTLGWQSYDLSLNYAQGMGGQTGESQGLDSFLINLVTDITGPMLNVVSLFAFVAGVFLLFTGLKRLTQGSQQGAKGPAGLGTIMTFVVGSALISFVPSMGVFLNTVFGTDQVATYADLSNVSKGIGVTDAAAMAHTQAVFTSLLAFLSIIGVVSFARGLFMMRDVADGAQNASLMGSMSHMIAGVCCVNFGAFANMLQNTLGLAQFGVTFQ